MLKPEKLPRYENGTNGTNRKSAKESNGTKPIPAKVPLDYKDNPNVTVLQSRACDVLMMKLRDKNISCKDFNFYADRIMRLLAEEALARLPSVREGEVDTPCGVCSGLVEDPIQMCVVSIPRSGDILQEAVRQIRPGWHYS